MYPMIDTVQTGLTIKALMTQQHLSAKDIQEYLNLSCVQTIYRWLKGESVPSIDNLYALSFLFHVSMDEIVQGNKQQLFHPAETSVLYACH